MFEINQLTSLERWGIAEGETPPLYGRRDARRDVGKVPESAMIPSPWSHPEAPEGPLEFQAPTAPAYLEPFPAVSHGSRLELSARRPRGAFPNPEGIASQSTGL